MKLLGACCKTSYHPQKSNGKTKKYLPFSRTVRRELNLAISVGVSVNKLLAKMACELAKPDGLKQVRPEDMPAVIWPLPVRKLHGVGPHTEEECPFKYRNGRRPIASMKKHKSRRPPPGRGRGTAAPRHPLPARSNHCEHWSNPQAIADPVVKNRGPPCHQ
ncbi:MAG: hypothetical protein IMW93_04440 [Thermoanaerobacteraceae bacterium]|nr:hypothetical protein [Thermoanaerobacteraceae bacterium]